MSRQQRYKFYEYLEFAHDVSETPCKQSEETRYRIAISRAYYAAFHYAKWYVDSLPSPPPRKDFEGSHDRVINCLLKLGPPFTAYGNTLNALKLSRVESDYHDWKTITRNTVTTSLRQSKEICEFMKQYL